MSSSGDLKREDKQIEAVIRYTTSKAHTHTPVFPGHPRPHARMLSESLQIEKQRDNETTKAAHARFQVP